MIIPPGILTLEQVYDLADDPRYLEPDHPDRRVYAPMVDRMFEGHLAPENWPTPNPYNLGRPMALAGSVGAGAENRPKDVAEVEEGLLAVNGLGINGWLRPSGLPTPEFNAAILGFQRAQGLKADGLVLPNGPTLGALNQQFPLPKNTEAGALNPPAGGAARPGRPITAGGLAEEQRAGNPQPKARDLFPESVGRYPQPIVDNVNRLLAPEGHEVPLGTRDDFEHQTLSYETSNASSGEGAEQVESIVPVLPTTVVPALRTALSFIDLSPEWVGMLAYLETRGEPNGGWGSGKSKGGNVVGRFQFRTKALIDIGMLNRQGEWIGKYGVNSWRDFQNNKWAQVAALEDWAGILWRYAGDNGLSVYIDDEEPVKVVGQVGKFTVSRGGMLLAMHYAGADGTLRYFDWLERNNFKSEGESFPDEYAKDFRKIEERLRDGEKMSDYRAGGVSYTLSAFDLPELPD